MKRFISCNIALKRKKQSKFDRGVYCLAKKYDSPAYKINIETGEKERILNTKADYKKLLKSSEWEELNRQVKKAYCEVCGATDRKFVLHHRNYKSVNDPRTMITVCMGCHRRLHFRKGRKIELETKAIKKHYHKVMGRMKRIRNRNIAVDQEAINQVLFYCG